MVHILPAQQCLKIGCESHKTSIAHFSESQVNVKLKLSLYLTKHQFVKSYHFFN
jgi:hypothetical protein